MWQIILIIDIIMACITAVIATVTKFDVSPLGILLIFLTMAVFFIAMVENG